MVHLTVPQLNTIRCLAEGLTNKEVGIYLRISEDTVRSRVATLLRLTGTKNRAHLVAYAFRNGLIV